VVLAVRKGEKKKEGGEEFRLGPKGKKEGKKDPTSLMELARTHGRERKEPKPGKRGKKKELLPSPSLSRKKRNVSKGKE